MVSNSPEILINFYLFFVMEVVIKNNYFGIETMEGRTGLLFLVVLGAAWACDSRELTNSGTSGNIAH